MERWIRMSTHLFFPIAFVYSLPWFFPFESVIHLAQTFAMTYIVMVGLNLLVGLSNQFSLGHVGFYAIGAYGAALFSERMGLSILVAILLAGVIAGGLGAMLSLLCFRVKGPYLVIVTVAFGELITALANRWVDVTGGTAGLTTSIPRFFGMELHTAQYFWLVGIVAVLFSYSTGNLFKGRYGRTLMALGNSEQAAETLGIPVFRWKVLAFVISAFLAGIGGGFFAFQDGFISSTTFGLDKSILFLLGVIVGGAGSKWGPALGTVIVVLLPQGLQSFVDYHLIIFVVLLLLCLILIPKGLTGTLARLPILWKFKNEKGKISSFYAEPRVELPAMEEEAVLKTTGLSICFGGLKVVSALDLRVAPGHIYGLIGPNGSGKSTTVNLLSGVYSPAAGEIQWMGQDISRLPSHRIAQLGITRTFQNLQVFQDLSVIENVMVGFHLHFHTGFFDNFFDLQKVEKEEQVYLGKAYDLLRLVGLEKKAFLKTALLSDGEQRMVEIARALAMKPRLFILDEPSVGGSPEEMKKMNALLLRLKDAGLSILLVEHHIEMVLDVCDRIAVLDYGEKIADGTPEEIQQNERVIEAYLAV